MAKIERALRERKSPFPEPAAKWIEEHRDKLPPEDLPPELASSLDQSPEEGGLSRHELISAETPRGVAPPPPRVNALDVPKGTHLVRGVGVMEVPAERRNHRPEVTRWRKLYEALIPELQATYAATEHHPGMHVPALAELEALHRAILPNWEKSLAIYFKMNVTARAHNRARQAPGGGNLQWGEQKPLGGETILAALRAADPETPPELTATILNELGERVRLGQGGVSGSLTIERAVELARLAATDRPAFEAQMQRRERQKERRKAR